MQRALLLLAVPVTCALACSETTQPGHQSPPQRPGPFVQRERAARRCGVDILH